jgi:hypothetical protein
VLYCGNGALAKRMKEALERETIVITAPNIRPNIDTEDLMPAAAVLSKITAKLRTLELSGLNGLASTGSTPVLPSAFAMARMMRFSSELTDLSKATLGVDLGAGATTLAFASGDTLKMNVFRTLGMGASMTETLQQIRVEDVARWLPYEISEEEVRDHLYQKSLFPAMLPMTRETLAIEQAAARQILRCAVQRAQERWPGTEMSFERIFLSGAALAQAATPAQALLMALDGLQPVGVNVVMLDPYGLSQALGAIASINTLLPAQILESGAYTNLGTVLCPVSDARPQAPMMRVKITYEDRSETRVEIKQGSLTALPIRSGQSAHLEVEMLHGAVLDPALPRLKRFRIVGGVCGVVVDARSRPLMLPNDPARRRDLLNAWARFLDDRRAP